MYPASTTKVMTLLLALESGISMDTTIVIPQQANQVPADSSLVPVFPGDVMTFRDLLYGFMLTSGNDGANAVAVLVSGNVESFVDRMNKRAEELGCEGTHFANPHGYHDENHYSTALDLARITSEAVKLDAFRKIVSAPSYTMSIPPGRQRGRPPGSTPIRCSRRTTPTIIPTASASRLAFTAWRASASSARRSGTACGW